MSTNFAETLTRRIRALENPSLLGLDPLLSYLPTQLLDMAEGGNPWEQAAAAIFAFNRAILEQCADLIPAVKFQAACYEQYGAAGWACLKRSADLAKALGYVTICDAKRNDIGSTAEAYARALLGETELPGGRKSALGVDAVTINAYLGSDGIEPFLRYCREEGKGAFLLIRTSNPSSVELQKLKLEDGRMVCEAMADLLREWSESLPLGEGYSPLGAVVGATWPEEAKALRQRMPRQIFLIPGYGAQGGSAETAVAGFDEKGGGGIVNASRSLMLAWKKEGDAAGDFAGASRREALRMRDALRKALRHA